VQSKHVSHEILALLIVATLILTAVLLYWHSSVKSLNRSVEVLLGERLRLKYQVKKIQLEALTTDRAGLWWVVLEDMSQLSSSLNRESVLQPADGFDQPSYKEYFREQLSPDVPLGGYQVYRGEALLGPGSACEDSPCNLAALIDVNNRNVFLSISTN